ncbi:hypothetical protein C2G38_2138705 [Gigaspora rosea]|uniref:Uncharacterized protein n=1 Tax=Gigaspora rosea TaxID=44941 RepID=A0A397VW55_9GLOM|nr:hypothetical protein C2G38_2138705 [Gigaspora rosea]
MVSATMDEYCSMPDNKTVDIKIIGSTFNQAGERYYVQMDPNFVRNKLLYEPLPGIDQGIVNYNSTYQGRPSEEAAICIARLTADATKKFQDLPPENQTTYFNSLFKEIAKKLPVRYERLTTDGNFQYVYSSGSNNPNIEFEVRVNLTDSKQKENSVPGVNRLLASNRKVIYGVNIKILLSH